MRTVAIVGVGLIGASFGLALRRTGFTDTIIGVSSRAALAEASAVGAITAAASLEEACAAADLIYLSQTVDRILETLPRLAELTSEKVLVTDAGSTKAMIAATASRELPERCFLGGHPLAGKEARGAGAADAELFRDRNYILCPPQGPPSPFLQHFREALTAMGARVLEVTPEEHDAAVAYTSHLPQLLSTALANTLAGQTNRYVKMLYGPGLIDMTRLAMSSPELWRSILWSNRVRVLEALDAAQEELAKLRQGVAADQIESLFEAAQEFGASLRRSRP
jgi:prephenate dehydrogenase